jgi:hypothetical protein
MKQLNEILIDILGKTQMAASGEYRNLYQAWNNVVEQAFAEKKETYKINKYTNDIQVSDTYRNLINARKAADHSKIKYIKNKTIYIEADHQGWIQILQTRQHKLLKIFNASFSELEIEAIAFVLSVCEENAPEKAVECQNSPARNEPAEAETPGEDAQTALSRIKDAKFRELLRQIGENIEPPDNNPEN